MAVKRKTPIEDMERLAENLFNKFGDKINSKETFSQFYDSYMYGEVSADALKPKVFAKYVRQAAKRAVPLKDVKRLKTKEVVKEFRPTDGKVKVVKQEFKTVGRIRGKIVFARVSKFKIKGKPITRFIDRKGRFVSVKKKLKE